VTWLEDFLTLKWPGSFTALAPPLTTDRKPHAAHERISTKPRQLSELTLVGWFVQYVVCYVLHAAVCKINITYLLTCTADGLWMSFYVVCKYFTYLPFQNLLRAVPAIPVIIQHFIKSVLSLYSASPNHFNLPLMTKLTGSNPNSSPSCASVFLPANVNPDRQIEQGLTSHQTHYRSYQGRYLQVIWPTNSVKALKEASWSCRWSLNPTRTTPPCYSNTTPGNRLYAWRKGPNVTNPICWTCKICSYECAADCEHCVTQPSTEQFSPPHQTHFSSTKLHHVSPTLAFQQKRTTNYNLIQYYNAAIENALSP